jgi:predicted metalloendopeptidase
VRWIEENQIEPKTVGLPYTPKQLFWVSFAQTWCTKYRDEKLKQQILTGVHSPAHFRVLGSVSNVEDFANDYNCPLGSNMNPKQRCSVW